MGARNWAEKNKNRFFTCDGNTSKSGYLDGQCVSLVKWFLNDNCAVKDPFSARGHAKDVGDTLVSQGYAYKVGSLIEGDIVVWKKDAGNYGHIAVYIGNNQVFESNAGVAGAPSKYVNGSIVYGATINALNASWRKGGADYYRVRSYKWLAQAVNNSNNNNQGGTMDKTTLEVARILSYTILGRKNALKGADDTDIKKNHLNHVLSNAYIRELFYSTEATSSRNNAQKNLDNLNAKIKSLETEKKNLNSALATAKEQLRVDIEKMLDQENTIKVLEAELEQKEKTQPTQEPVEQKENKTVKDGAVYKTFKAGVYATISGVIAWFIAQLNNTPELFGVYAPAVNMVLVAIKKWFDSELEKAPKGNE